MNIYMLKNALLSATTGSLVIFLGVAAYTRFLGTDRIFGLIIKDGKIDIFDGYFLSCAAGILTLVLFAALEKSRPRR